MNHFMHAFADELIKVGADPIEAATRSVDPKKVPPKDEGMSGKQTAAVAGAAAAPFAGMIGQEKLRHDPHRNKNVRRFKSMDELSRHAKPGDIIITSKPKSIWKTTQSPFSGSEFYHAQPVVGRRAGRGTTASAGNYGSKHYQALSRKNFADELMTIGQEMKAEKYKDVVLLRPKVPLKGGQLKKFVAENLDRSRTQYDTTGAIKAWGKDLFMPKMIPHSLLKKEKGVTTVKYVKMKDPDTGKMMKRPVLCKGNVCSTMPAMAMEAATGKRVVRGKHSKDVMPADFLRSKNYETVGARIKNTSRIARHKPLLLRAGIGVGMAGGAYAATENPEVAAGVAGAAGGSAAHKALAIRIGKKKGLSPKQIRASLPNLMRAADGVLNAETPKAGRKAMAKYIRKSLPAKAIGGAAAYMAARHFMGKKKKSS